jgi:hypothetical protein
LVVDLPEPDEVPRIPLTSRTVSSLHEPFGAAVGTVDAAAGAAANASPATRDVHATMQLQVLMGRAA